MLKEENQKVCTEPNQTNARITEELPIPKAKAPEKTTYEVDVLVVGGGFAGVPAAIQCKKNGQSVLLIDKGSPGYSGYMPWPHTFRWFDPELGDDREAYKERMKQNSEFTSNQDWYEIWLNESKSVYESLKEWKFLNTYDIADSANEGIVDYHEKHAKEDRHLIWHNLLIRNRIEFIEQTMITDVIEQDGQVIGAMGFHVPSGTIITIHAKATIMCTGAGSYKPTGFPTGSCTFDSEAIGYRHGLKIAGKEYSDFHGTPANAAGSVFESWKWEYVENMWLCGGVPRREELFQSVTASVAEGSVPNATQMEAMLAPPGYGGGEMEGLSKDDPRIGLYGSPMGLQSSSGGAVGMGIHKSEGVFIEDDKLNGATKLPGFYVAGDAHASMVCGATYCGGFGFSAGMSIVQGRRAADAACQYAASTERIHPSEKQLSNMTEQLEAPLKRERGFDPNWARDVLQATMAPYWINYMKTEGTLKGALASVEFMRDNIIPKLVAVDSHGLRLCHEMQNKIISAEMKLRAGFMRQESRGMHYRYDFPFRDDKNWLCYIGIEKDANGSMSLSKIPYPDSWKGDLSQSYEQRYFNRFPGEAEALGLNLNKEEVKL